jgi:hypothetical protein
MNRASCIFAVVLCAGLFFYVRDADAWGRQDRDSESEVSRDFSSGTNFEGSAADRKKETLRIEGRVRLVGSMPFPSTVIPDSEDNDWYIEDADRELVKNRQQETVIVEGSPQYKDLVLANGEKIGVRRYLRNIRIIDGPE